MGEDVVQNVVIGADASGATAGFAQVAAAMQTQNDTLQTLARSMGVVTSSSQKMGAAAAAAADTAAAADAKFSGSLAHGGVFLFSRQLLGMVGLSDVARHAMGAISIGFESVAASAGMTTAALAPWLFALGGAIIVYEKFAKANKTAAESMEGLAATQSAVMAKTVADAQTKERQDRIEIGNLEALRHEQVGYMNSTVEGSMMHDRAVTAANEYANKIAILTNNMHAEHDIAQQGIADLHAHGEGYDNAADKTRKLSEAQREAARSAMELSRGLREDAAAAYEAGQKFEEFRAKDSAATGKVGHSEDIGADKTKEKYADMRAAADAYYAGEAQRLEASRMSFNQYNQSLVQLDAARAARMTAIGQAEAGAQAKQLGAMEQVAAHTFQSFESGMGHAFAQMAVDGKSWGDAFKSVAHDVESQFISMVTTMMIKWAAFTALTGGFGASAGFASTFTGFTPHATGTDFLTSGPTPIMAGEGGEPERVRVTPLSQDGGGGGGSSAPQSVGVNVTVTAAGVVTDIRSFANMIGQQVVQQVKGQGQLQFVRGS